MDSLGTYLHLIREEKKLSLNEVYKKTGITDSRLSKLENNLYQEPSPLMLKQLADFYDISIVDLYIKAGYLTYEALNICSQVFHGIDKLTEDESSTERKQLWNSN